MEQQRKEENNVEDDQLEPQGSLKRGKRDTQ